MKVCGELPISSIVSGSIAALAIFESDELVVLNCYEILRECIRREIK